MTERTPDGRAILPYELVLAYEPEYAKAAFGTGEQMRLYKRACEKYIAVIEGENARLERTLIEVPRQAVFAYQNRLSYHTYRMVDAIKTHFEDIWANGPTLSSLLVLLNTVSSLIQVVENETGHLMAANDTRLWSRDLVQENSHED